jgi:hypothetical protein
MYEKITFRNEVSFVMLMYGIISVGLGILTIICGEARATFYLIPTTFAFTSAALLIHEYQPNT